MRLLLILTLLLTALPTTATATVSAAMAASPATTTSTPTEIQWRACPGGTRAADAGLTPTARSPAAQGQQCGQIRAPLDHGKANGPAITIAVSRLTVADPAVRRGVLLIVPGGPGGAGLDLPGLLATLMPPEVLARYDLVSFDPRLVGRSTPVTCGIPESRLIDIEPWPRPGLAASMDRIAAGCDPRLAHTSSADIARDMDLVRRALGEERLSLLGYSAGTYLSAVYQSLFPDRVDRALLDSGGDPALVWRGIVRAWGAATEARFPDFAAYGTRTGLVASPAEARALYFTLAARLDARPVTLPMAMP
ncbi:alpha/beta fold hydrolase [Actinokineospora terrae]|uniref:Alpha/beta hydrolase fold n=1 Tax=Actinokineospora terrae TaxID=155974 RepID=A0A1H9WS22_9PSEU|nr:alpha/beta fold hydrolase [Actinokineospora terrae]SES36708.1 alpha/beta hydrolase fold [Actinokineospora terrae]